MNKTSRRPGLARRVVFSGLALALAASAAAFSPVCAYADDQAVVDEWSDAASLRLADEDFRAYTSEGLGESLAAADLPSAVDLRAQGLVTPVKNQSPWNTCWAFAAVSAGETSLLSSAKAQGIALTALDLSELQLAALVYNNGGVPSYVAGAAQAGEGYVSTCKDPDSGINAGGTLTFASSLFAAGIGPVAESAAPYKNKDGAVTYLISGERIGEEFEGATAPVKIDRPSQAELDKWTNELGLTCTPVSYSGTYWWAPDGLDSKEFYADWSVDQGLWQTSLYELTDGNILPETRILTDGECTGTDMTAVAAIKSELCAGRAVAMSFHADDTVPGAAKVPGTVSYLNGNWAHYTYKTESPNHGVTIVGYDDAYSRANFGDGVNDLPEGDGAWIVKNSFGSQTEDFPNNQGLTPDWGLTDADGNHTGYFYVSYYDKSVTGFETYEFDLSEKNVGASTGRIIDQYDYLPVNGTTYGTFTGKVSGANIFTADADMAVRALWCETTAVNTTVTYYVYLLDDDAEDPTDAERSRKVYSATETYDYGGYHRYKIADSDWIAMRAGQRYSVVVTQAHRTADGAWAYTQPVNYNEGVREYCEYGDFDDEGNPVVTDTWQAGFVAKVNAGESWVTSSVDDWTADSGESAGSDAWTDWSLVTAALTEKNKAAGIVFDNLPIKAYAQARSWASVDELASLEERIAAAEALLASASISADGTDVAADGQWLTQAEHDALAEAVDAAKSTLALAGTDFRAAVLDSTPSSDEVNAAASALGIEARPGKKQAAASGQASAQVPRRSADKARIPSTGDAAPLAAVPALAGAAVLALRRRLNR